MRNGHHKYSNVAPHDPRTAPVLASDGHALRVAAPPSARRGACTRRWKTERGSTLVEFALIVMVLMAMILGIIEFSRALYAYHFVNNAAKTATRWAAVNGYTCGQDGSCTYGPNGTSSIQAYITDCEGLASGCGAQATDIQAYVKNLVPMGINRKGVTTTVSWPVQSATSDDPSPAICSNAVGGLSTAAIPNYPGCTVEVAVTYKFNFIFPFIHSGPITMSSSSEMVISH